jgi:hypothetical protein
MMFFKFQVKDILLMEEVLVTFTEALKIGDKVNIIFYKGNGDSDVIFRNIIETVKKGDTLQIKHDDPSGTRYILLKKKELLMK